MSARDDVEDEIQAFLKKTFPSKQYPNIHFDGFNEVAGGSGYFVLADGNSDREIVVDINWA
jgi:hypothetical protein